MKNTYIESYILLGFLLLCGCANIAPPNGGEKDTFPPKLISAKPENKSVFFNSTNITLKFDEYIQLKNSNLIQISPNCGEKLSISQRGKQIEIALNCSLEKNTTYSINFGNSIIDLNEGNELTNFKYIFSTGSDLDSLKVEGEVHQLYNDNDDQGVLIALYKDTISDNPYYYTFSEPNGQFEIENIKKNNYILYAFLDENGSMNYDEGELNSLPCPINHFDTIINLGLFYNSTSNQIIDVQNNCRNSISFQHNVSQDSIKVLNSDGWWNTNPESSVFWFNDSPSSIKYELDGRIDSIEIYNTDSTKMELKISNSINEITKLHAVEIISNTPIKSIKENLFNWQDRDSVLKPIIKNSFTINLPIDFSLKNNAEKLIIHDGAISDVFGFKNDSIIFKFDFNSSLYGKLIIHNASPKRVDDNYVLELFQQNEIIHKQVISDSLILNYITPGTYSIRLFNDLNNDFFWTTGNVNKKNPPEPIYIYPETIEIKSNWEIDVEIRLEKNIY